MKIADMTKDEREAFGALLRLVTRLDGSFTSDEGGTLDELADQLGRDELWGLVETANLRDRDEAEVRELAAGVKRREVQETMHHALYTLAIQDILGERERELLDWLAETWGLDQQSPYRGA